MNGISAVFENQNLLFFFKSFRFCPRIDTMKKSNFALIFEIFEVFYESQGKIRFILNLLSKISYFSQKARVPKIMTLSGRLNC